MRARHLVALATVVVLGFGVKLLFQSSQIAEANVDAVANSPTKISRLHVSTMLPGQRVHDMTFVFADVD